MEDLQGNFPVIPWKILHDDKGMIIVSIGVLVFWVFALIDLVTYYKNIVFP
jgi:hypothetical protein